MMPLMGGGLMHQDEWIDDYVRGRMSGRRCTVMESHLQRCPRCRDRVARAKRAMRRTSTRPDEVLSSVADAGVDTAPNDLVTRPRRWVSTSVPVIGSLVTLIAFVSVLVAAWHAGGRVNVAQTEAAEDFTVAGAELTEAEVSDLRRAGWTCADLDPMGLDTAKVVGRRSGDVVTVSTTYRGDGEWAVVAESRWVGGSSHAGAAPTPTAPTPTASAADGVTDGAGQDLKRASSASSTTLRGRDGGSYAISSTLGSRQTERLVARVERLSSDRVEDAKASSTVSGWERLQRGWAELVEPQR
jgi:hypothetical protein